MNLSGFKAYDVRGRYPSTLDEELARNIGFAFVREFGAKRVVVGHDARLSGPALYGALAEGLRAAGADVTGVGMCGTEEIYFAAFAGDFDGGIMVTGSHNPADENGFKMVRRGAVPVSGDSGLFAIRGRIAAGQDIPAALAGGFSEASFRGAYLEHLLGYVRPETLKRFRIVADPGNGCAGLVVKELAKRLPLDIRIIHAEPDGTFPHGVPNPLLPENRALTAQAVRELKADFGLAWDGDFDRCFFYDAEGRFIEGYYLVGMIAEALLASHPGAKIIHDPRLVWNTREVVKKAGGIPVESKTGHAFIKERMRAEDALYGGEMSAHHYFRNFAYCDSGMIPWLLVAQLLSDSGKSLAECVDDRMRAFPCSGEINSRVDDMAAVISRVEAKYAPLPGAEATHIDGLSVAFPEWRFNLRGSNTEPILRLNVESRGNAALMEEKTEELLKEIRG
ncbi:phosphomannomutase [Mailhella massiliensis]|uniref:Phosphomannomutase n=1 Tax=Mailhella massiliensis TaxID=1903261 RepID=A0A921DS42_9BACT|nr:phosphomannomutase [Mailhella massiliensis]HJD98345.1 phosphomannomutase [Mailhella massiliensis]